MIVRTHRGPGEPISDSEARYIQRLPGQLATARARVARYENDARHYGMLDLLHDPKHANRAWDEAIDDGRARHGFPDVPPPVDNK